MESYSSKLFKYHKTNVNDGIRGEKMKKTLTYFLLFSILISYGNMEIQSQSNDRLIVEHDSKSDKPIKDLRFNYEERDRIEIYDDGDLASESSEGDGSEEFPYVIEGWRIETGGNYPGSRGSIVLLMNSGAPGVNSDSWQALACAQWS